MSEEISFPDQHPKLKKILKAWRNQDEYDSNSILEAYRVGRSDGKKAEKERLAIIGAGLEK